MEITNKKAAPHEQPQEKYSSIDSLPLPEYFEKIQGCFSSPVVLLKLKGYTSSNRDSDEKKRYQAAKIPIDKGWSGNNFIGHELNALNEWIKNGGWIGLRVPEGYIVVDVDDVSEGHLIHNLLELHSIGHYAIKTPGGYQFIFTDPESVERQNTKMLTELGFVIDFRLAKKGQIVLPLGNVTEGRKWLSLKGTNPSRMPTWFNPLKAVNQGKDRPFVFPISEGGRNTILFKHAARLREFGRSESEILAAIEIIGKRLCDPPMEDREISSVVRSASRYEPTAPPNVVPFKPQPQNEPAAGRPQAVIPKFDLGDLGNAERFIHYFGKDLRYCFPFKAWFVWNGSRWVIDEKGLIKERAKTISRKIDEEVVVEESDDRRNQLRKQAQKARQKQSIDALISLSESSVPVLPDQMDNDPWLLNVRNGVVDLRTGALSPHEREHLITKQIGVDYDPSATCPKWERFLSDVMQDREGNILVNVIEFLQKSIGYSLTGETMEQCLFFLHGTGKNGKSTFIDTIQKLMADYAEQTSTETFLVKQQNNSINNDIARLRGARFVSATESEDGKRLAESLIKQLTGGDRITARFLHKEFFTFKPSFKIFFATNHKPKIRGTDYAIWRRIRLIPFNVTIDDKKVNPNLPKELEAELPGILNWAVKGCMKWQQEGLKPPVEVQAATDDYKQEMDSISDFIEDCLYIDRHAKVSIKSLSEAYSRWCTENNEYEHKKAVFSDKLVEWMDARGHFVEKARIGHERTRGWEGIGLLANMPHDFQPAWKEAAATSSMPKNVKRYVEDGVQYEEGEL